MGATETDSSEMWRLIGAALLLAILCAGAVLVTLRADAQQPPAAGTVRVPAATTVPAMPTGEIPDDPTVAPDASQKADDNVSFPVDI